MTLRIDHIRLPVSDIDVSRAFYAAALAPLGYRVVYDPGRPQPRGRLPRASGVSRT